MRIDDNIDTHLSKQQFGFSRNSRCYIHCALEGEGERGSDWERDVSRHIALASAVFGRLGNGTFSNRRLITRLNARLYGALILPITICGAEACTLRSLEIPFFYVLRCAACALL